jgi:hypothetical protein
MKLDLLAAAYEDRYAVVEEDNALYMLRPPYLTRNKMQVSRSALEQAVVKYGFSSVQLSFENWDALISHLKTKYIKSRKAHGHAEPDTERIRGLVRKAPRKTVETYLARIADELIPNREWEAARSLLETLLLNKIVQQDSVLITKCAELSAQCREAEQQAEAYCDGLLDKDALYRERFPSSR